jgi:hypothetical protein
MLHEEIGRIEWQGEQIYNTPTRNTVSSRVVLDQLTPLLPKDSEVVNAQFKCLHAMLDASTLMDLALDQRDKRRDQDPDHR